MLPIDEDILITRYGDSPAAAHWYQNARAGGLNPHEAIQATERLIRYADGLPFLSPDQVEALERYANACADGMAVLDDLQGFRPPTDEDMAALQANVEALGEALIAPYTHERIQALIKEARRFTDLVRERLGS